MADDLHYVPGDFYRIDDRSGFKVRAKKQRKEWTGLIVEEKLWEIRHPQDFVKGVIDDQTVPEPRSKPVNETFTAWIQTTLTAFSGAGSKLISLASTTGMQVGDVLEIMLDTKELFRTTIVSLSQIVTAPSDNYIYFQNIFSYQMPNTITSPSNTIAIAGPLPYSASIGNIVEDLSQGTFVQPVMQDNIT